MEFFTVIGFSLQRYLPFWIRLGDVRPLALLVPALSGPRLRSDRMVDVFRVFSS